MFKKTCLTLAVLALGGCRIVSQQELADLKSPPNPHMANMDKTWQQSIVPQVVTKARPAAELMSALKAAKDIDSACKTLGYRAQDENPCIFYVKVSGIVSKLDTASRSGKMTLSDASVGKVTVQIGPTLRGTQLRDGYSGASYQDFNDQVLFGEYSKNINSQAVKMIQTANVKTGDSVEVYGVFSAWDIPQTLPEITPAKIIHAGDNNMAPHDLVAPQPVESEVIIETRGLSRVYPGVTALDNVNYRVYRNKVNVLIGENGAGKSTMMKMLAGVETPSSGQIILDGEAVSLQSTHQAEKLGISIIFQELNLFPNMNVMDNIFMANEFFQKGRINEKYQYALAKSLLERLELDVDPYAPLGELGIGHQQLVEIARALSKDTRVLIMDEPTSALSQSEVKVLFKVIAQLKRRGVTIIYISHRLEELMEIGDNITIFRDGRFISERHVSDASVPWIIEQMVGDKKKHFDYQPAPKGDAVLDVKGLTALHPSGGYKLNDVTFTLSKGEVIGIYGLLGAGRTELFKGLVGLMPCQRGEVHLNGESIGKSRFQQRLKKGLALVPEDRQGEGVVQMMSIQANMTLSDFSLQGFRRAWRWLNPQKEESCVKEMIQQLAIKVSDATLPITSLSGGNQQKVVLGKALMTQPQVVFLDEPTRGIDVGAKTDVYHLIGKMAQQGLAVMFSSSELDEVMALADRILVMADGRITADLPRHAVTREQLIAASTPQD